MANQRVTDHKWHDIKYQELPDWVKRRTKQLDSHELVGRTFRYRRNTTTGRYQRRLRYHVKVNLPQRPSKLAVLQRFGDRHEASTSREQRNLPADQCATKISARQAIPRGRENRPALRTQLLEVIAVLGIILIILLAVVSFATREFYAALGTSVLATVGLVFFGYRGVSSQMRRRRLEKKQIEREKAEIIDMIEKALKGK